MPRKIINPGNYRHKITIRNAPTDSSRNAFGERIGVGTTVATVWAEKQDWSGRESAEFERSTAEILTKFLTRYRTGLLPNMEVVDDTDVYFIESIMDFDGTKRELTLNCRRVVQ